MAEHIILIKGVTFINSDNDGVTVSMNLPTIADWSVAFESLAKGFKELGINNAIANEKAERILDTEYQKIMIKELAKRIIRV